MISQNMAFLLISGYKIYPKVLSRAMWYVGNAFSWFAKSSDILKWSQKDYSGKTWVSGPVDSKSLCHSGQMSRVPKVSGSQSVSQQYQMYLKNKDLHCIVQMNIFLLSKLRMICMCVDLIGNFLFHGRTLPIYLPPPPKHINCFLFLYMPVLVIPRVSVHTVKHGEIKFFLAPWKLNTHIYMVKWPPY